MPFRKLNEIVNLNEIYFFVSLHLIQDPYSKRLLQNGFRIRCGMTSTVTPSPVSTSLFETK